MSLLDAAKADAAAFASDLSAFAVTATITDPDGLSGSVRGRFNDVTATVDPDTGVLVSGRDPTFVVARATLSAAGLGEPVAAQDAAAKPWLVLTAPGGAGEQEWKVGRVDRDEPLGLLTLYLEAYDRD